MKVLIPLLLIDYTYILQQIHTDTPTKQLASICISQIDEFTEAGTIVIAYGLGIAEGFKDGVGLQDAIHGG